MQIKNVMTRTPASCKPADTLDVVARLMLDHQCGEIPVCDGGHIVGVITDRDITCRAVALRREPLDVPAREVMTHNVYSVNEHDKIGAAVELFRDTMVRRLPVTDDRGQLVGILSQADLATKLPSFRIAWLLKSVAKKTRRQIAMALALLVIVMLAAPAASAQKPRRDEGRIVHRDNDRVTVEGRVRDIHRERDGYRVELDRNGDSFWVPERAVRSRAHDFRIGVSLRFGGIFRDGVVIVDVVDWPPFAPMPERHRYAGVLRGFVERVHYRSSTLRVRQENTGRLIDVSVRRPFALDDVRRGDFVMLSGEWKDRDEFDAVRVERPRR